MNEKQSTISIWLQRGKVTLAAVVLAGIGFLIGAYLIAPMFAKATPGYIPSAVLKMPAGMISITNPDGTKFTLPVRIADSNDAREQGLRNVGAEALETTLLLYDQEDESTWGEDYEMKGIRAPLSLAVIGVNGEVLTIKEAKVGEEEVEVEKDHRWVLAMKKGILNHLGIQAGSTLNTGAIKKFK